MSILYLLLLFFMASSTVNRSTDSDFPFRHLSQVEELCLFPQSTTFVNRPAFKMKLPCLYMCTNKKLRHFPNSKLNFCTAALILLSGDVSLNPGPSGLSHIRMATLNVRSLNSKCASFSDLVISKKLDIVAITETWLSPKETSAGLADLTPKGFKLFHQPRKGKTGGGVAIMVADHLNVTRCKMSEFGSFEAMCCKITSTSFCSHVICLYRPPGYPSSFFQQFQDLLENMSSFPGELFILGDFNLHLDIPSNHTECFVDVLSSFGLQQLVNFPTHIHGHWLDLFITRSTCDLIKSVFPSDGISDHMSVIADIGVKTQSHSVKTTFSYRRFKDINMTDFMSDITNSTLIRDPKLTCSELYQQYHTVLTALIDKYAPVKSKTITPKPPNPWMTPDIQSAKRRRQYLERVCRRSRSGLDRSRYRKQANLCNRMMATARRKHYTKCIDENSDNPKKLWKTINNILHRTPTPSMPAAIDIKSLSESFSNFFIDKITKIRMNFRDVKSLPKIESPKIVSPLTGFEAATTDEIKKLITKSPSKTCDLDPIPPDLLKSCLDVLLVPITQIVNLSLVSGTFPDIFKTSHVTPLLKKPSLSKDDMKNYRPVSNLNFVSKIIEKVIANRIRSHLEANHLSNQSQSAYKKFHSTETALLKVENDIILNMDKGKVTALTLLDLSAAFDTLDHRSITDLLSNWYGISGVALEWFVSYLSCREQKVKLLDCLSSPAKITNGVPQGSVLGPLLFTLYTAPLSSVIGKHSVNHHLYADDTQIYLSLSTKNPELSLEILQNCLQDVSLWMTASKLKLNPDKTEFLLIGVKVQREKFSSLFPTQLLEEEVIPAPSARNLGIVFDNALNFKNHISLTCRACYYHIRDMRRIRGFLTPSVAKTIATSLIGSRLDYCNSLFYNITERELTKLQGVQNCLARVVTKSPRFCHITPLLKSLHWLPIRYRIKFKICSLTYQALTSGQPSYFLEMLKPSRKTRKLRSCDLDQLNVPRVRTSVGSRAFSVAAPRLWNELPLEIRQSKTSDVFRKKLKTLYFGQAFPS